MLDKNLSFFEELDRFAKYHSLILDWDQDDGEEWGRYLFQSKKVLLFHAKYALVFVEEGYFDESENYFTNQQIKIDFFSIENWSEEVYVINSIDAKDKIGWSSYNIGEVFSINSLWFHTI